MFYSIHKVRGKRFWGWEFKNLSWWVAQAFIWGSVSWVINGFAVWLDPLAKTSVGDHLARISALVGGSIFEIGATLAYFEALNRPPKADKYIPSFYKEHHKASKKAHVDRQNPSIQTPSDKTSNSSPARSPSSAHLTKSPSSPPTLSASVSSLPPSSPDTSMPPAASPASLSPTIPNSPASNPPSHQESSSFDPASSTHDLSDSPGQNATQKGQPNVEEEEEDNGKTKFRFRGGRWRELGYIAAVLQLIGANIFYISCITGMHGVINEDDVAQMQSLYWTPQVVGAMGFVIAGMMYMYEVQPSWWQLRPMDLGWHVGFWNWLGAVGFALCGIFGYYAFAGWGQHWGTTFSTFWGGWAFLIGSYIQLFECLNK